MVACSLVPAAVFLLPFLPYVAISYEDQNPICNNFSDFKKRNLERGYTGSLAQLVLCCECTWVGYNLEILDFSFMISCVHVFVLLYSR